MQADGASSSAAVESFQERFPLLSELIVVETAVGRDRPAAKVFLPLFASSYAAQQQRIASCKLHLGICLWLADACCASESAVRIH